MITRVRIYDHSENDGSNSPAGVRVIHTSENDYDDCDDNDDDGKEKKQQKTK